MEPFDTLWNYNKPAETEKKFKELLTGLPEQEHTAYRLQLLTQIARTCSLQQKFEEAHHLLNEVEQQLGDETGIAHIRYFLERGRTYHSSSHSKEAEICFLMALDVSKKLNQDFYTIDALHMLAMTAPPLSAVAHNEAAVLQAENSANPQAKNWLGSLYHNLAWNYFDLQQHEKALSIFLRGLKWRLDRNQTHETFIAKWCVARTLRELKRLKDALKIQLALFEELVQTGQQDGYVHEELGELYLLMNDKPKSVFHFQKAYELLSAEPNLAQNGMPRLERIKQLCR